MIRTPPHVIVCVDDEPLIRLMACEALTDEGFDVIEASHAAEAIEILNSKAADVHALFTDIHMPGSVDGLALAHHTRQNWPWIAVLIASGKARPGSHDMPHASRFLPKPYLPHVAVMHLRELINAS